MQADSSVFPFKIEPTEKYVLITLVGKPNGESAKTFEQEVMKNLEAHAKPVVINCQALDELNAHWMRVLTVLSQHLKSTQLSLRLIELKPELILTIKQNALAQVLPFKNTLQSALIDLGLASSRRIDVNFINPFLVATIGVLKIQANVIAKPGQPYKCSPKDRYFGDVSGVIGLISDAFEGAVVLSFPEKTFLAIMSSMLGEKIETLTQEIADGAGELTNIIFGQAKVALNEQGFGIKTAIPTVVTGSNHNVQAQTTGPRVALLLRAPQGLSLLRSVSQINTLLLNSKSFKECVRVRLAT